MIWTLEEDMAEQKHILIVDDDIELGTLLAQAVSDMSPTYTVKLARDVDEAMVQVRRSQTTVNVFDLVITDIKMIGLNGFEFLEALHALAPDLKTIAMTAYNSSEIARRARELDVQAYLTKPFLISEFRQAVRDTLNAPIQHRPASQERSPVTDPAPAQRTDILHALTALRTTTAVDAVFLVRNDGALIESDGISTSKHVTDLGTELYNAGQAITAQMTHLLGPSSDLQRSLFATDRYSICTYRVDNTYTVAVVFGSKVREGQVWYYLRETATKISRVLHAGETTPRSRSRTSGGAISDILEQFFPDPGRRSTEEAVPEDAHRRRGSDASLLSAGETHAAETEVTSFQEVDSIEADAAEDNTAEQKVAPEEPALDEPIDFSIVESIDWDAADGMSWDTVLKETDQGLGGLTFEEAQRQGLLDNLESN